MNNASFMVIHDTEQPIYKYEPALVLFKYRWDFKAMSPYTTVVSMTRPIPDSFQKITAGR
jgi:hypothetical protein